MEAQNNRYNTLVYIEQELYVCLNDLADDKFQIKKILETDNLTLLFPAKPKLSEEHIKQLGRLEVKNYIFGIYVAINKYNRSISTAMEIFERNVKEVKNFNLQNNTPTESNINFYQNFKKQLETIDTFAGKISEEIKICLTMIRFFLRTDKTLFVSGFDQAYYDKKEFKKWLTEDKQRLEIELSNETCPAQQNFIVPSEVLLSKNLVAEIKK